MNDDFEEDLVPDQDDDDDDLEIATPSPVDDSAFNSLPIIGRPTRPSIAPSTAEPCKPWAGEVEVLFLQIITNGKENATKVKEKLRRSLRWTTQEEQDPQPWYLGLIKNRIDFQSSRKINLQFLMDPLLSIPYWLKLKTNRDLRKTMTRPEKTKGTRSFQATQYNFSMAYGALTDLNRFSHSPHHIWTNDTFHKGTIHVHDQSKHYAHVEWIFEDRSIGRLSKRLSLSNINQCVIVDLLPNGFILYIEQKCNLSEYKADIKDTHQTPQSRSVSRQRSLPVEKTPQNTNKPSRPPPLMPTQKRESRPNGWVAYGPCKRQGKQLDTYFSTLQFRLEAKGRVPTNDRGNTIQEILSLLIEIFLKYNISVCYGKIHFCRGEQPELFIKNPAPNFGDSLVMNYAWHMLSSLGYRFQLRIDNRFLDALMRLSQENRNPEEFFYRVCVYLTRGILSQPFIDILAECERATQEILRKQSETVFALNGTLKMEDPRWAYVPSVTLTPTVVQVKPLKLCRTNRVLRDKFFGEPLINFVLVDIRDENGEKLPAYNFRDLRGLLLRYLEEGFPLTHPKRYYRYLHHTQSQLRDQQFWFYYHETDRFAALYRYMGNFEKERNPAKYAKRMAQWFSTTTATVEVI